MKTIKQRLQETIDDIIKVYGLFKTEHLITRFIDLNKADWDGVPPTTPVGDHYISYVKTFAPDTVGYVTPDDTEHFIKINKSGKVYLSERPHIYNPSEALDEIKFTRFSGLNSGIVVTGGKPKFYTRRVPKAPIATVASAIATTPTSAASVSTATSSDGKSFDVVLSGAIVLTEEQRKLIILKFWEEKSDELITLLGTEKILDKIGVEKSMEHFS